MSELATCTNCGTRVCIRDSIHTDCYKTATTEIGEQACICDTCDDNLGKELLSSKREG